jgi:hypothetical protein
MIVSFGRYGGEVFPEAVEPPLPLLAPRVKPQLGLAQPMERDAAGARAADLSRAHEPGLLEDAEVLHGGRQGHRQRPRELAHRGGTAAEALEHRSACGVRECMEQPIKMELMIKHLLKRIRL